MNSFASLLDQCVHQEKCIGLQNPNDGKGGKVSYEEGRAHLEAEAQLSAFFSNLCLLTIDLLFTTDQVLYVKKFYILFFNH